MFFFQFEVRPNKTHPQCSRYGGAMVNCWIQQDTQTQAEAVARSWIADEGWRITAIEKATLITRDTQNPDGMQYLEQAEIDGEVFLFHTWPVGAPDNPDTESS